MALQTRQTEELMELTLQLRNRKENDEKYAKFRGDSLIGNPTIPQIGTWGDIAAILKHPGALAKTIGGLLAGKGIDAQNLASIAGSLSDYSTNRQHLIDGQVKDKYDKMLHPPLTYLGDAFQYRTADGKFNSVINPHLGQAGAPYAKTVPSKTAPLGALPDPADLFDKLMMREEGGRESKSGLSSMLIYHATIIIHDIFRTNDNDKNISDSSSYLDLSPLYGYTDEMQRKVRDGKYKLGLLKPDTFAEDRLLRQPPGVCIMLVMYNRYHNYAARQLARINENGRFSVPRMYSKTKLVCLIQAFAKRDETSGQLDETTLGLCKDYEDLWRTWKAAQPDGDLTPEFKNSKINKDYEELTKKLEALLTDLDDDTRQKFETAYEAAWTKLDDDLFNTARLITCGIYIQISVHDYLRALMGFHQFDTNFTLDPRADFDQKKTSRGIGNQVTVEFNLLYRFHCAISLNDEKYTEEFMKKRMGFADPRNTSLQEFLQTMASIAKKAEEDAKNGIKPPEPWEVTFGIPDDPVNPNAPGGSNGHAAGAPGSSNGHPSGASGSSNGHAAGAPNGKGKAKTKKPKSMNFTRNPITNLFDDDQMLEALTTAMDAPISNFGPRNTPKCLKAVEIMGITQARKWEVGTLNDFREFFGMSRHATFEAVTANVEIQNTLRDLYEHPDKIELYPGIFCESDQFMGLDPGPKQQSSALWTAIFSDAITLVRSDRFYTVDWNTNSLTSWGMQEVTPDNSICKSSVFHRLIQRAFPGWLPYNSIRFFHPFYTAEQNAIYAKAQGYGPQFKETQVPEFKLEVTPPEKPNKPWYIDSYDDIQEVLGPKGKNFLNPALYYRENLPKAMADVLDLDQKAPKFSGDIIDQYVSSKEWDLKKYLEDLMRYVIRRESIAMTHATFQIDATRDFAIPVVTRYVADFLGFGDKIRVAASSNTRTYSENEIYQHITNCQIFLSYNTDETKLLKRRNAFKASLVFLSDLTRRGNIFEANQWGFARAIFGKKATNPMSELGVFVAKKVLEYEPDQSKAAAILLLVCLDFAYNAVVSFTATLDSYMKDLYALADLPDTIAASEPPPQWLNVQKLAFSTMPEDSDELEKTIRNAALSIVKIPILRKALVRQNCPFGLVLEGQTVIINLSKAIADAAAKKNGDQLEFLTTQLSIAGKYGVFQPRRLASLALYSMVKFIAQMRNPRRGHDAQGKLKRIRLDKTAEGYYNYMAPMRIRWIQEQVERLPDGDPNKNILTDDLLKPEADTYLTPTWSEFVPFPMTWKIRFDGFGESDYKVGTHPYGRVTSVQLPDYTPPWYQPQGASHVGGSFATVVCICAAAKTHADANAGLHLVNGDSGAMEHESHCPCLGQMTTLPVVARTSLLSTGCGMGERVGYH